MLAGSGKTVGQVTKHPCFKVVFDIIRYVFILFYFLKDCFQLQADKTFGTEEQKTCWKGNNYGECP